MSLSAIETLLLSEQAQREREEYRDTIYALFGILSLMNQADSELAMCWQRPLDADGLAGAFGDIRRAIVRLAGERIVAHWAETGEIDLAFADRLDPEYAAILQAG